MKTDDFHKTSRTPLVRTIHVNVDFSIIWILIMDSELLHSRLLFAFHIPSFCQEKNYA